MARGIKKDTAHVDTWMKDVAPSTTLRKWFNHEPEKWQTFISKYQHELKELAVFDELVALIRKHKSVTLLYGAKDDLHNQAVVLKKIIDSL